MNVETSSRTGLVAEVTSPPNPRDVFALGSTVGWWEVRADRLSETEAAAVRSILPGQKIYALRSRAHGGAFAGDQAARRRRLVAAARDHELVELEEGDDLDPQLLAEIPAARRLISWRGPAAALAESWRRLATTPARFYKLVVEAPGAAAQLVPLALLAALERVDVVAFAAGQEGFWTRLVAPHLGSPMVFAPLAAGEETPSVSRLIADYDLPADLPVLPASRRIFGIVGRGVLGSLSPRLHNGAYRILGIEGLYLPFPTDSFGDLWHTLGAVDGLAGLGMQLRGLTVVAPHKEAAFEAVAADRSEVTDLVRRSGAANLLTRGAKGTWRADSTDPEGVLGPLCLRGIPLRDQPVAVVGCGGSGRTIAAALAAAGAQVVLVNRDRVKGQKVAEGLALPFVPLADFDPRDFAVVVQATPVGRDGEEPPFDPARLGAHAVVIELVYGKRPSPLIRAVRERGLLAIDGREVLLTQTRHQIHSMTGHSVDLEQLRSMLEPSG